MNVIVRMYWQHDLDLVALTSHPMFQMGKWMKKAMIAYTQGDKDFHIPLPPDMPPEKPLVNCDAHFALDPNNEIEKKVIDMMKQFRDGQRNSAIKHIFRRYLDCLFMDPYIDVLTYQVKARGNYKQIEKNSPKDLSVKQQKKVPVQKPAKNVINEIGTDEIPNGNAETPDKIPGENSNDVVSEKELGGEQVAYTHMLSDEKGTHGSPDLYDDNSEHQEKNIIGDSDSQNLGSSGDAADDEFNLFSTIENLI